MKEIKDRNAYTELVNQNKPVLLDFYADWCGPCQSLLPIVERLADKYEEDVIIAKVNVDQNPELSQEFGVRSIPALFFVRDGQVQESLVGLQSEHQLDQKIQAHLNVASLN